MLSSSIRRMCVSLVLGTILLNSAPARSITVTGEVGRKLMMRTEAKLGAQVPLNKTETQILNDILLSWGKQRPGYKGFGKNVGFKSFFFRDDGMFDFDPSVRSVAIDVGAANNPLYFDMNQDASQVVFALEPGFYKQLEKDFEEAAKKVDDKGGCIPHKSWRPECAHQRMFVFPAAAAAEIGHATFRTPPNPYCGSLNNVDSSVSADIKDTDKHKENVYLGCWGGLPNATLTTVPTITLASILKRIPPNIAVKYVKIDAQGLDFKIVKSAEDQLSRIGYVRFEMQKDPPEGRKMVSDVPKYDDVVDFMANNGLQHEGQSACVTNKQGASAFSKSIKEMECIFCQHPPCKEPAGEQCDFCHRQHPQ